MYVGVVDVYVDDGLCVSCVVGVIDVGCVGVADCVVVVDYVDSMGC